MPIRSSPALSHHPMRVVTRRTGLSPDLLRAWERRYEIVKPTRSENGRRLYSDADIERLRLLYRATLAGRSIGQIASLSTPRLAELVRRDAHAERAAEIPAHVPADSPPTAEFLSDSMRAIERLDAIALEAVLRRATVTLPGAMLLDDLVVPLLERIGTRWLDGTLRPVHEHLASAVLRRLLDRVTETAASLVATPHLIVATPAGQLHEFGAMLAAATAAAEGWRVTYLGVSLPAEEIAEAAARTRARLIALSIVYPSADAGVAHELRRLRKLLPKGVDLAIGGAASSSYRTVVAEIGGTLLGDLTELRSYLGAQRHRRERARDRATARRASGAAPG